MVPTTAVKKQVHGLVPMARRRAPTSVLMKGFLQECQEQIAAELTEQMALAFGTRMCCAQLFEQGKCTRSRPPAMANEVVCPRFGCNLLPQHSEPRLGLNFAGEASTKRMAAIAAPLLRGCNGVDGLMKNRN
mmetsp:Transcript_96561/g.186202  ORF Transcript_96561/g.186202 Transcript_96561/m.186202 type:complete len:132 (+) Transcript_96561:1566-1961(+)